METQNQENQKTEDKTIIISMISGARSLIFPFARKNNVGYKLLGIDQNENDIMEFIYSDDQQDKIDSIKAYLNFFERLVTDLKPLVEPAIKVLGAELTTLCEQLNTIEANKEKAGKSSKEPKTGTDGNNEGKHAA